MVGKAGIVNHSETAIVLPRCVYGLPEVDEVDLGHLIIYCFENVFAMLVAIPGFVAPYHMLD